MYKIYNDYNEYIKCRNLNEVERVLLNYYNKELIKPIKIKGYENIDVITYNYNKDYYGNPLYIIIFYNTENRRLETIKSKQSYHIEDTIKNLLNKLY